MNVVAAIRETGIRIDPTNLGLSGNDACQTRAVSRLRFGSSSHGRSLYSWNGQRSTGKISRQCGSGLSVATGRDTEVPPTLNSRPGFCGRIVIEQLVEFFASLHPLQ